MKRIGAPCFRALEGFDLSPPPAPLRSRRAQGYTCERPGHLRCICRRCLCFRFSGDFHAERLALFEAVRAGMWRGEGERGEEGGAEDTLSGGVSGG